MLSYIKKAIFRNLSFDNYLRIHQRGFLSLYKTNFLRLIDSYNYHYNIKRFINKGDVVVDIGANLGYYSMLFAKWVGSSGKVYSVEPIASFNKIFNEQACKFDNIVLYPYALGTEEKDIKLVSSAQSGYFRTGLPHVYDAERDGQMDDQQFAFDAKMKIPSKLFADIDRIDYIKCDVEGFEYVVISDMKDIIARHKPIVQVEVWGQNEKLMKELFKSIGYLPYKLQKDKLVEIDEHKTLGGDYIFIHQSKSI